LGHHDVNLQLRQIRRERRQATRIAAGPPELEGKYQSYTQADISALRSAGYAEPFLTVEEGVTRYVGQLYERRSAQYQV